MTFVLRKAERKKAKLRLGIVGPSGSGKTYSSLLIAYGITGDWSKIALIDTENGSGDLYAHLGEYNVLTLEAPYTPDRYIEAIKACEDAGMEAIIIDSLSHAWAGEGGALDIQGAAAARIGNSWSAWREVTPMHNALVNTMLTSKCHIIATMRAKTEYVQEKDPATGKSIVRKIGLAPVQRDGMEYEFTITMDISTEHIATASKDRTGLFDGQYFKPSIETGKKLLEWLESGVEPVRNETAEQIKAKWMELGKKPELLDAQCRKLYGKPLHQLTEPQGQELLAKMSGKSAEKAKENPKKEKQEEDEIERAIREVHQQELEVANR
mgnify:CR=1 FL=1